MQKGIPAFVSPSRSLRPLSRLAVRRLMVSILPLLLDDLVAMSPVVGVEALWQCLACNTVYLVEGVRAVCPEKELEWKLGFPQPGHAKSFPCLWLRAP